MNTNAPLDVNAGKEHVAKRGALGIVINSISKWLDPTSRILSLVAAAALAVMMFLTFSDVSLRYIFNRPITGTLEITELLMFTLVIFGMVYCAYGKAHIRVDIFMTYLPRRTQSAFNIPAYGLAAIFYIFIIKQSIVFAITALEDRLGSYVLLIPFFPFVLLLILCATLLVLIFIRDMLQSIDEVIKG